VVPIICISVCIYIDWFYILEGIEYHLIISLITRFHQLYQQSSNADSLPDLWFLDLKTPVLSSFGNVLIQDVYLRPMQA